jgi:catechol 2,3-dioxygenase-like lactoylglutathione lyase family enzyme
MRVTKIQETCLYARDLVAIEQFYTEVLGLELHARDPGRYVFFRCGSQMFLIFDPRVTERPGRSVPAHGAHGPGHVAFAIRSVEVAAWRKHLESCGVTIEEAADWAEGRGQSIYFRDPAGNSVELITPSSWGVDEAAVFA